MTPALDEGARELVVDGEPVAADPARVRRCSTISASAKGKPSPRQDLLRDVWGTDYTGGSNVVDAVVRSLRRKLGAPQRVVVETVRGRGYRLRADWRADLR